MPLDQIDVDKLKPGTKKEMSFLDHLEELRWHIIRAAASILIIASAILLLKSFVFDVVILGPTKSDFLTYTVLCSIADFLCMNPGESLEIITRDLGEQFVFRFHLHAFYRHADGVPLAGFGQVKFQ